MQKSWPAFRREPQGAAPSPETQLVLEAGGPLAAGAPLRLRPSSWACTSAPFWGTVTEQGTFPTTITCDFPLTLDAQWCLTPVNVNRSYTNMTMMMGFGSWVSNASLIIGLILKRKLVLIAVHRGQNVYIAWEPANCASACRVLALSAL